MKKRTVVLGLAGALILAGGGFYVSRYGWTMPTKEMLPSEITLPWGWSFSLGGGSKEEIGTPIYVDSVANITGQGAIGINNRFTGSVETQETVSITFDSTKKLDKLLVEEGDEVKKGDPLFSYDTDEMNQKILQADLELEQMDYELQSLNEQLVQLQAAKAKAKAEELPAFNIQEMSAQNEIRRKENDIALKQVERAQLEKSMNNAIVLSELDGIIKKINKNQAGEGGSGMNYDSGSDSNAFITILKMGDYRIKGTASEMSIWSLEVGQKVLVRPRADESRLYHGTIIKKDTEPVDNSNQGMYYYGDSSGETVSKYNFYIELEDHMDLMLGQHVLIELDQGQEEKKEGLWLPSYYIAEDEEGSFVWKADEDGYMEKARITIGELDEEMMESQILEGLDISDYIAFPEDIIEEGARAVMPGDEASDMNSADLNGLQME